jgi:hypothetical protein
MAGKAKPPTAVPSASVGALVAIHHALPSYLGAQVREVRIRFGD